MRAAELAGRILGWLASPVTGALSALRRARVFHPEGHLFDAWVSPSPDAPEKLAALGLPDRLSGRAVVRLSNATWTGGREWIDVLGFAIRFSGEKEPAALPRPGDQDLLLATIRRPWTLPFAFFSTRQHDFLANDYYAITPFLVEGLGSARFRIRSPRNATHGQCREERLANAVHDGIARFELQLRQDEPNWTPLIEIRVIKESALDQEALRFRPFQAGRGIAPQGFIHWLREGTYWSSQKARPFEKKGPMETSTGPRDASRKGDKAA